MFPPGSINNGETAAAHDNLHTLSIPSTSSPPPSASMASQSTSLILTPTMPVVSGSIPSLSGDLHLTPSEIYRDHLQRKNMGHPLWIPGSNERLPVAYRASGVMPGDVGVITSQGGFSYLFNVLHESMHPRNAGMRLPPDFVPFATSLAEYDIEEFREYEGVTGCYLADESVIRVNGGDDSSKTVLQTSAKHAAVLMLPETVHTTNLLSIVPLRDYIRGNLPSWYSFVRDVKGWDVKNGDIRVVHSCRKSSGYGIATVSNGSPDPTTEVTFSVQDASADDSGCRYRWSHRGCATVKAGPTSNPGISQPANQCLFIGTIDFKLGEDQWRSIEHGEVPTFSCHSGQSGEPQAHLNRQPEYKYEPLDTCGPSGIANSSHSGSRRSSCDLAQFRVTADYTTRPSRPLPSDILADVLIKAACFFLRSWTGGHTLQTR
ncbi:hypothetical protein D9619_002359 [Psilocybe cf. subviscida]|uniref:Uncharacterized protein n=1 Tax=Psilocybe cf. subviscida TaxID=2480587 RepID=A0A8H5AW57_9AGAR|nr:hypothetical protein D9619_002359 [Psilocybe cf. subviscida]